MNNNRLLFFLQDGVEKILNKIKEKWFHFNEKGRKKFEKEKTGGYKNTKQQDQKTTTTKQKTNKQTNKHTHTHTPTHTPPHTHTHPCL